MKKYKYTIEFVTDSPISEREQCYLAGRLHQLIVEAGAKSGEEVYAMVGFEKPTKVTESELTQFKLEAGYEE